MARLERTIVINEGFPFSGRWRSISKIKSFEKKPEYYGNEHYEKGVLGRMGSLFRNEKEKIAKELDYYLNLVRRDPENTKARLKLAELYLKGEKKHKAVVEHLTAAEIFYKNELYPQAMAIYKKILKYHPAYDEVNLRIADICRRMGFLGDAFGQYSHLLKQYKTDGEKEKAQEVMGLMAGLDPEKFMLNENPYSSKNFPEGKKQKVAGEVRAQNAEAHFSAQEKSQAFFDLSSALEQKDQVELEGSKQISMEKVHGFLDIFKELKENSDMSQTYPRFSYHLGIACREMGFIDEAIEQFKMSLENGENFFESAKLLGLCFKEKGWWEEARESLERALEIEEVAEEKKVEVKKELDFIRKEREREKQAFGSLNEFSSPKQDGLRIKKIASFGNPLNLQEALTA